MASRGQTRNALITLVTALITTLVILVSYSVIGREVTGTFGGRPASLATPTAVVGQVTGTPESAGQLQPANASATEYWITATSVPPPATETAAPPTIPFRETPTETATPTASTGTPTGDLWQVSKSVDNLNLRAEPGGSVLGLIAPGTLVRATGTREDQGGQSWVEVVVVDSDQKGWVAASYLEPVGATSAQPTGTPVPGRLWQVSQSVDNVNLRQQPNGRVLRRIDSGTTLRATGKWQIRSGITWLEVVVVRTGQRGWVAQQYLEPAK